jgi:hypothetical protein
LQNDDVKNGLNALLEPFEVKFPVDAVERDEQDELKFREEWSIGNPPTHWPRELISGCSIDNILTDIKSSYYGLEKHNEITKIKIKNKHIEYYWNVNGRRTELDYLLLMEIIEDNNADTDAHKDATKYLKWLKVFTHKNKAYFKFNDFSTLN